MKERKKEKNIPTNIQIVSHEKANAETYSIVHVKEKRKALF
jgi:hypothetical protein